MKIRTLLFTICILNFFNSYAQKNFKAATIVTRDNQTLNGYINYKEWFKNPSSIEFSSSNSGTGSQTFRPADIRTFDITGLETYESYSVEITTGTREVNKLPVGKDSNVRRETVFLQLLERGKINLYRYTDQIKSRFYIKTASDPAPVELKYYMFMDPEKDLRMVEQKDYIDQLIEAGKPETEDLTFLSRINSAPYRDDALLKIVRKINNNTGKPVNSSGLKKIRFIAGAGATLSDYSFTGYRGTFLPAEQYSFNNSTSALIFAGTHIYPNPRTGKLFFRGDLSWFNAKHKATASTTDLSYKYDWTYDLEFNSLELFLGIGYSPLNTGSLALYASVGPDVQFFTIKKNNEHEKRQSLANPSTIEEYDLRSPSVDNSSFGFSLRAGATINKQIDISVAYNGQKKRFMGNSAFEDHSTFIQFRVGYIFGKTKK